jgi:hypothetical protein
MQAPLDRQPGDARLRAPRGDGLVEAAGQGRVLAVLAEALTRALVR